MYAFYTHQPHMSAGRARPVLVLDELLTLLSMDDTPSKCLQSIRRDTIERSGFPATNHDTNLCWS
jgi:hypothetical protein